MPFDDTLDLLARAGIDIRIEDIIPRSRRLSAQIPFQRGERDRRKSARSVGFDPNRHAVTFHETHAVAKSDSAHITFPSG